MHASILLSPVGCSSSDTILYNQASTECPSLGVTMAFEIQPDEFVQVLHDGHGHCMHG